MATGKSRKWTPEQKAKLRRTLRKKRLMKAMHLDQVETSTLTPEILETSNQHNPLITYQEGAIKRRDLAIARLRTAVEYLARILAEVE